MTPSFVTLSFAGVAVALRVALAGVRLVTPGRRPAPAAAPNPAGKPDHDTWRPHVLSGCGR